MHLSQADLERFFKLLDIVVSYAVDIEGFTQNEDKKTLDLSGSPAELEERLDYEVLAYESANMSMPPTEQVHIVLDPYSEVDFSGEDEVMDFFDELLALYTRFVNDVPLWRNHGYSASELRERETGRKEFFNEDGTEVTRSPRRCPRSRGRACGVSRGTAGLGMCVKVPSLCLRCTKRGEIERFRHVSPHRKTTRGTKYTAS